MVGLNRNKNQQGWFMAELNSKQRYKDEQGWFMAELNSKQRYKDGVGMVHGRTKQ